MVSGVAANGLILKFVTVRPQLEHHSQTFELTSINIHDVVQFYVLKECCSTLDLNLLENSKNIVLCNFPSGNSCESVRIFLHKIHFHGKINFCHAKKEEIFEGKLNLREITIITSPEVFFSLIPKMKDDLIGIVEKESQRWQNR